MEGHKSSETCDMKAAIVFTVGLAAGTGCTIASKALFQTQSIGKTGEIETFHPPLFQTWVMFLGMSFAMPAHFISEYRRRQRASPEERREIDAEPPVTAQTYMLLAIPSVFDLIATCMMVIGLLYVNASIWMLLRGGGIVFVALMKNYALGDKLKPFMWCGVSIIAVAVLMVGYSPMLAAPSADASTAPSSNVMVFGVLITLAGTFVQSIQYTYEEKVMGGEVSAPPWLLIGMEGVTGTILSTFVLYPIAWAIPGSDHGSYEDPINTMTMLYNSPSAIYLSVTFCVLVFLLNSFSVLVTFMLSSIWHAILDNFRPLTIWIVELMIYYCFTHGAFGEAWTLGSWLQLAGMCVLLFGTAVYNGSIAIPGIEGTSVFLADPAMSSPGLVRSPLLTQSRPPLDLVGGNRTSPYVARLKMGDEESDSRYHALVSKGRK